MGYPTLIVKTVRYIGKRVAVIGGGHSAINTILELTKLNESSSANHLDTPQK